MGETELVRRLEKLERDNQRLKRSILGMLILAAALGGIYAARPVPEKIEAHEFDLVDSSGRVRGAIDFYLGQPGVTFYDAQGKARLWVGVGGTPIIWLSDAKGTQRMVMLVEPWGEPSIMLTDPQGFGMDLGDTPVVTERAGKLQNTSAASIVMFGNDKKHNVIWHAP